VVSVSSRSQLQGSNRDFPYQSLMNQLTIKNNKYGGQELKKNVLEMIFFFN
jgi:hypothetical protein